MSYSGIYFDASTMGATFRSPSELAAAYFRIFDRATPRASPDEPFFHKIVNESTE